MEKAEEILEKYKNGQCTPEELALLRQWFHHLGENDVVSLTEAELMEAKWRFERHIGGVLHKSAERAMWYRIAAAAIVLVFLGFGAFLYIGKESLPDKSVASAGFKDIGPGGNKAILTLADGRKIVLDEATNGKLAEESGIRITKTDDGQVVYETQSIKIKDQGDKIIYNVIETPRGGQYKVILPDGSTVWLNAASSLKYPVHFSENERRVELRGEGFFDIVTAWRPDRDRNLTERRDRAGAVAGRGQNGKVSSTSLNPIERGRSSKIPFIVQTATQDVEVLGTQFNINTYDDEPVTTTTLLEGSVKVLQRSTHESQMLLPGQQAVLSPVNMHVVRVDTDEVIAWKEGMFRFSNESLESIMRKISRWYDVDVEYADKTVKSLTFNGIITHFSNASKVLDMMERTKQVRFRLDGQKIIVYK